MGQFPQVCDIMVLQIIITIIANVITFKQLQLQMSQGQKKTFLNATGKVSSEQLRKVEKIKPFRHSRAKKKPHFDHFPRPGEIDPYIAIWLKRLGNKAQNRLQEFLRSRMGWMGSHPLDCYYFYRTCGAKKEKSGT